MKTIRIISISLLLLTAINAVIAGALFIVDPSGQKMGMAVSYLRHSPFHSFLLPGIVLFVVNGLFNFGAAYAVIKNRTYAFVFTVLQGVLLCGWILVQVFMVKDVSALHIIMFCIGLILIICGILSLGSFLMKREFRNSVKFDFSSNNALLTEMLTETDIAHLPSIVQKYLHYTKSMGQPKVKNFRAEFVGGMRGKPNDAYMKMHSVQYNFYQKPSRYFFMEASKMGLPATGLHIYHNETATFEVRILNWLKVVDAKGDKLNQAETVTLFNDMCLIAPATLIDPRIKWETINATTVKGIFTNENITISAMLYFNEKGELINFVSNDRYETNGKQYHNYPWATPAEDYRMLNGYYLPSKVKLIYQKPEGDFTYGELTYKSLKYNLLDISPFFVASTVDGRITAKPTMRKLIFFEAPYQPREIHFWHLF